MAHETTIGTKLRQARLDKNISLIELQQMTKIQKRYLEAIEADQFAQLPGTFYVRAFIRQYAAAVGEDGDKLVAVFDGKDTLAAPLPKRPQPETVSGSRKAQHVAEKNSSFVIRYLPMILLGLVALTIMSIVGYMAWQDRNASPMIQGSSSLVVENSASDSSTTTESTSSTINSSSSVESTTESSTEKEMTMTASDSSQSAITIDVQDAESPLTLTFTGQNGRCWIGVQVDGAYVYQYTLTAGETQTTTLPEGADNAVLTLGASQYVTIEANDQPVDFTDPQYESLQKTVNMTISYADTAE